MSILSLIDPAFLRRIAGRIVERPGEYADLFVERMLEAVLVRTDGRAEPPLLGVSEGSAARVLEGERVRHAACAGLEPASIALLPRQVRGIIGGNPGRDAGNGEPSRVVREETVPAAARPPAPRRAGVELAHSSPALIDAVSRHLEAIEAAVLARFGSGEVRVGSKAELQAQMMAVATSEGEVRGEDRTWISFSTRLTDAAGASVLAGGGASDLGRLLTLHRPDEVAARLERGLLEMKQAAPPPAGEVNAVLGPGAGGILIHEACGHALEGDRALRGRSALVELLGEKVGPSELMVVDDPTLAGLAGSRRIDDEGWPSARNVLIDSGRLVGLLLDRTTALLAATTPTGSARRESYRDLPMPRMSNTFVAEGRHFPEEILASVKRGLYIAELGAGEVDTVSADFSFRVQRGYLIAGGKMVAPVRPFVIHGNGLRVLNDIQMIGVDLKFDPGAGECGKEGQRSRAAVGQPTIKVAGLAAQPVGGRERAA